MSALALELTDVQIGPRRPDVERGRQLRAYRRVCREIDRLLVEGRLAEAQRLNDQARTLYRCLFAS